MAGLGFFEISGEVEDFHVYNAYGPLVLHTTDQSRYHVSIETTVTAVIALQEDVMLQFPISLVSGQQR
jgi:hypothetical protein